jgi:hypothetical protein
MHPYSQQPDASFWRRFVSDTAWSDVDFVGTPKFTLRPEDKVSMAGSCFAQHIARHMRKRGLTPFQTESAHPLSREAGVPDTSYDMFSARFGNVYTSRQCLELLQQAVGARPLIEDFVTQDGRVYDLLRPNAIPGGFAALEEAQADRRFHMARVRAMFEGADVLVYTLGLTESWCHRQGAYTYPVCPGTARGVFDPQQHQFHNLTHTQVVADLVALVELAGQINPGLKFIFTVSPVPLVATYTQQNVLLASSYSKSVLRAACGEVAERYAQVMYFPSYEIISHPASFGQYLQGDLREVTERGVSHVMRCFFAAMYPGAVQSEPAVPSALPPVAVAPDIAALLQGECEEMFNDLQRGGGAAAG